jgi:hypothetical protein
MQSPKDCPSHKSAKAFFASACAQFSKLEEGAIMKWKLSLAGLLLLAAHAGFTQDTGQWSSIQSLRKGDRVGVIQASQKRVEGRFESATDARLTLSADQEITLEKAEVVRVYRPARHGRVFGAVLGGAIGLTAGGIVDATGGQYFRNETGGTAKGLITAIGGAAGAGIGAAVTGGYRTVYQRGK